MTSGPATTPTSGNTNGGTATETPVAAKEDPVEAPVDPEQKPLWNPEPIKDMFGEWMSKAMADHTSHGRSLGDGISDRKREREQEAERLAERKENDPMRGKRKRDPLAERPGVDPLVVEQVKAYEKTSKAVASKPDIIAKVA